MNSVAHVYAILGKKLCGRATPPREFRWRIEHLRDLLSQEPRGAVYVAFLGKGEGRAALHELRARGESLPTDDKLFVDEFSTNSIGNFRVLGAYLVGLLSKYQMIRATIVSSDYHIDRISFVDQYLQPLSLVNELPSVVRLSGWLKWAKTDFSGQVANHGPASWFATVYSVCELMMPLRINLEGLVAGKLNRIVRQPWLRFQEALNEIERLLGAPPKDDCFAADIAAVREFTTNRKHDAHRLGHLAGALAMGTDETELTCLTARFKELDDIRNKICDPDRDKFDSYF
jgi:hypothetical protein